MACPRPSAKRGVRPENLARGSVGKLPWRERRCTVCVPPTYMCCLGPFYGLSSTNLSLFVNLAHLTMKVRHWLFMIVLTLLR